MLLPLLPNLLPLLLLAPHLLLVVLFAPHLLALFSDHLPLLADRKNFSLFSPTHRRQRETFSKNSCVMALLPNMTSWQESCNKSCVLLLGGAAFAFACSSPYLARRPATSPQHQGHSPWTSVDQKSSPPSGSQRHSSDGVFHTTFDGWIWQLHASGQPWTVLKKRMTRRQNDAQSGCPSNQAASDRIVKPSTLSLVTSATPVKIADSSDSLPQNWRQKELQPQGIDMLKKYSNDSSA